MQTIFKSELKVVDHQTIELPQGAKMLTTQLQNGVLCLWYLCDTGVDREVVSVHIIGTGNPANPVTRGDYVGTVQQGPFVWHVFVDQR